jgi:outer membrane lipoprotein SlyB
MLLRRMEAPEMLAIDRQGRTITLASSRAPQMTFDADGQEHVEQSPNSQRTMRVTSNLVGDQLTITTTGNRDTDFTVTFDPINNGRQLRVTRRLSSDRLNQPVVVQSTYDQVSPTARWDLYNGSPGYANDRNPNNRDGNYNSSSDFLVPDGALIVGRLNDDLDTTRARAGDRFTLTVISPPEYRDATIEGHVVDVNRSGRLTGRADLALAFDSIRMRDGRTARFDGTLDSVRAANGENIRVDAEGTVKDDSSQTNRTVTRTAVGSAIGAVIGAIAGGGKGAAVGAVVGGGAGAGSVFVQGRNDLQLRNGTEITIRTSAPNRRATR